MSTRTESTRRAHRDLRRDDDRGQHGAGRRPLRLGERHGAPPAELEVDASLSIPAGMAPMQCVASCCQIRRWPASAGPADAVFGSRPLVGVAIPIWSAGRVSKRCWINCGTPTARRWSFAVAGVTQDLEPRTVLLKGATVEVFAALGPDEMEVLVYGSPGHGPVRRVLLGGVSSRLIRRPAASNCRATCQYGVHGLANGGSPVRRIAMGS